jgi:hypothetical protein
VTEPKLFVVVSGDIWEEVDVAGPSSNPIFSGRKMIGLYRVIHSGRRELTRILLFVCRIQCDCFDAGAVNA